MTLSKAKEHFELGKTNFYDWKYKKAIFDFTRATEIDPSNAEYYYFLSNAYHLNKQYENSIEAIKKAINLDPNNSKYYYCLNNTYFVIEQYSKSIQAIKKAIDLNPENSVFYDCLGSSFYKIKNYKKAIKAILKAIELDPNTAEFYYDLSTCYQANQQFKDAIVADQKSIALSPDNAKYHYSLSISYCANEQYDEAIVSANKAINLVPNVALYYFILGRAYQEKGMAPQSIQAYQKAIELNPSNASFYCDLGIVYFFDGQYSEAIASLRKAVRKSKYGIKNVFILCLFLVKNGDIKKAVNCIKRVKSPIDDSYLNHLSIIINLFVNDINSFIKVVNHFRNDLMNTQFYYVEKILSSYEGYKALQKYMIQLFLYTRKILIIQSIKDPISLAHYTSVNSLKSLFKKNNPTSATSTAVKLRLSNASYMNDPSEGVVLLEYLCNHFSENRLLIECCHRMEELQGNQVEASEVYLFSLSSQADDLPMWLQYGDFGKGCSLVFDKGFFDYVGITHDILLKDDGDNTEQYMPYRICYINKDNGTDIESAQIKDALSKISNILIKVNKLCRNNKDLKDSVTMHTCENINQIRYLFKSNDYKYEDESRLIKFVPMGSNKIQLDTTVEPVPKLFIEANNGKSIEFAKVILGPKIEHLEIIVPYLKYVNPSIEVKKSTVKFR
ncbi:MAG: tetratricopeptide repeat protein [Chitinophagales bacterium]